MQSQVIKFFYTLKAPICKLKLQIQKKKNQKRGKYQVQKCTCDLQLIEDPS